MADTCNFTHLNTSGAAFTWSNGWRSRGRTERRLDRSLCDIRWFDSWPHSNCIALPKVVSDHNPLIFSGSRVLRNGHRPFRFQSMWVQHPSFRETVTHCWSNTVVYGCPMFIILQKLKALKTCLRQWNFSVFGDVHNRVANARHNLSMIQQRISIEGINNDLFEEEIVAKTTVMESLQMQEAFWKDRARVKWLTKGDRNSSFFHAYACIKSSSSHISCILDGNNLLTDPLAIENHIVNFYQTLFGSSFNPSGIDEVCEVIQPMVTDSENDLLSALPTDEEIKEAVFSLSASSAPGPDGFPGFFYHHCWDIVSFDVIQFVKQFFQSNWLYPNTNSNFLVLIPKVEDAISMTHFRPIALANFLFKIIPKILAVRLSHVVQRIISPHQAAFIPGRRITDCIGLVSECFNVLDKKTRGGNMGVKVDIAKAFDTLDWSFLLRVLTNFGFSTCFIDWVSTILRSAKLSILINGSPHGFFPCSRGVRQGDPLSPLLFCLAEEALSRGLSRLQLDGLTKPTFAPRGCISPSHVLYADDLFIFCRSDGVTLRNLQGFFDRYSRASGQFINKAKSTFYLGSTSRNRKAVVESYLGFKEGKAPFVYLGVPIFCGKPKRSHLQALADKAKAKLTGWKGKLLSMAGRVQLTQSVFQSMLLHSFSVYKWPSSLLRSLSRCARNFIWSGDVTSKNCDFAQCAWRWLATQFGTIIQPTGSLSDLWLDFLSKRFSPHLRNVWLASGFFLLMAIWKMRNKVKFEGKPPSFSRLCRSTSAWIRQVGALTPGHVRGTLDRQLLVSLGISPNPCKAPSIVPVLWHPPPSSWVKVNTDGLAKGNPGPAACGGVFRDSAGYFLGGFSLCLGHRTSFYAELHAVILAVELAHARGWQNLWLESDSSSVISCFASGSFSPPWSLQTRWNNWNAVADKLANLGLLSSSLVWHSTPPIEIIPPLHSDFLGMPTYRFVSFS
ncbi:unnamed protein product [Malus baccata var. baccata]